MNDFSDTIQQVTSHAQESNQNFINSRVAIMVAISATIMAICNIKHGNIVQAMGQANAFEKEYEDLNIFDDQFDMTEAFISIAIAIAIEMLGITALTQKNGPFILHRAFV